MKLLLGIVIGWIWCKIFNSQQQNSVPRTTALEQNSVPITTTTTTTTPVLDDSVPITTTTTMPVLHDEELILETRDVSPAHFLTKIESFSLFSNIGIDKYETREFEAGGGYKWRLVIYPNGNHSKGKNDHVSVYLAISDTKFLPEDSELNVLFTIFLYNQILDKYLCFRVNGVRPFNVAKSMWGFSKFISKKSLTDESRSYLVDDNFVLGAEVFVLKRQRVVERVTLFEPTTQKRVWKIRGFSKLDVDIWSSEEFTVSDVNWKLEVYPTGHPSVNGKYMSVFLVCVSADSFAAHQKVKADFNIRLKGWPIAVHDSGKISQWFTSSTKSRGLYEFISLDWLWHPKCDILVKDCCIVETEIYVKLVVT